MNNIFDKNKLGFNSAFCHKIIRKRNKFLINNNLPNITFSKLFPKSYLPINFINNINDKIYEKIENNIINKISDFNNINADDLQHNVCYYVENNFSKSSIYEHLNHCNYSFGYLILLNETTYYEGGNIYINEEQVNLENNILFFKLQDEIKITNILEGEQHKLIGFVNYNYNESNNIIDSFKSKKLNICKNKNHILYVENIIDSNEANNLHSKFLESIKCNDSIYTEKNNKRFVIINDDADVKFYHNIFTYQFIEVIGTFLEKYNLNHKNMLPIKISRYENSKQLLYFTSLSEGNKYKSSFFINNKDEDEIKFTLIICINEIRGKIIFPNQNIEFDLYNGAGVIVPNNFIYSFYIKTNEKNIINDENACFIEVSFY